MIHNFLTNSYWAKNVTYDVVKKSIKNSFCFGIYKDTKQIGFARVVTDYATTFYLCDVIITDEYRGKGLGKMLMDVVFSYEDIQGLFGLLMTKNAHDLYRRYGFQGSFLHQGSPGRTPRARELGVHKHSGRLRRCDNRMESQTMRIGHRSFDSSSNHRGASRHNCRSEDLLSSGNQNLDRHAELQRFLW